MKNKSLHTFFIGLAVFFLQGPAQAQLELDEDQSAIFIGGVSPFILAPGQFEVSNSASLVSYWNIINTTGITGSLYNNIYRLTQFQNRISAHYGFSQGQKWDLGADITYTRRRWDDVARNSPFKIFNGDEINRSGISLLGLKARVAPFGTIPEWIFQGSVRFPMANGEELRRELGANRMQFSLITSYFKNVSYANSFYITGGWTFQPSKEVEETGAFQPALHALSGGGYAIFHIWGQSLYFIPGLSYSGTFQKSVRNSKLLQRSHAVLGDLVIQYQFSGNLSLSTQLSYPLLFESYTPLVDFERRSFNSLSFSLRALF